MRDLAVLVLRIGLGAIFCAHGVQKAFGAFSGPGINGFSQMLAGLGFNATVKDSVILKLKGSFERVIKVTT